MNEEKVLKKIVNSSVALYGSSEGTVSGADQIVSLPHQIVSCQKQAVSEMPQNFGEREREKKDFASNLRCSLLTRVTGTLFLERHTLFSIFFNF